MNYYNINCLLDRITQGENISVLLDEARTTLTPIEFRYMRSYLIRRNYAKLCEPSKDTFCNK
jgi:hypothetical protein